MISTNALRMAGRRVASTASRRTFSAAASSATKNDNARKALLATAGLTLAVAALQEREVSGVRMLCDLVEGIEF